jgi:hypothetical protein
VDQFLLHCDVASVLWISLFSHFGMSWVMPRRVIGGHLIDQGMLLFGKWCPFVSFGAYGGKETIGVLKTWKDPWKKSFLCSITLCIVGFRLMSILCIFLFLTFLLAFLFLDSCFSCILPVY